MTGWKNLYGGAARAVAVTGIATLLLSGCNGDTPTPTSNEDVAQTQDALNANEQTAYNFFVAKGLKNFQAAGVVGNLIQESNVDPTVSQFGGGPGRGIAQWSAGGRWDTDGNDNAVWYAGQKGESVWTLNLQLEFIWYELQTFSGYGFGQLKASTDVAGATIAFEVHFEGCGQCNESGRISDAQQVLNAWGATPPPTVAGYIDSAADVVNGWSADTSAGNTSLKTDLTFDGPAGSGFGVTVTAADPRPDVAAALMIGPNHGFAVPTPRYYCDSKAHPVHAYGHAVMGGTAVELKSSPQNLTCAPTPIGAGVLRHVTSPAVLTAWGFDVRALLAWMTTADRNAHNVATDWPDTLVLGKTSDGAIWVVDGTTRRHVINPASLAAWGFGGKTIATWSATEEAKYTLGLDLPAAPLLAQEIGNPAVYVVDADPAQPPVTTGSGTTSSSGSGTPSGAGGGIASGAGGAGGGSGTTVGTRSSKGCSFAVAEPDNGGWALAIAGVVALMTRMRRGRGAR